MGSHFFNSIAYFQIQMNFLDEKKAGDAQVKAHSLEWIGSVCGKIVAVDDNPFNFVQEFQANISISDYIGLWEAHKTMLDWLSIRQEDDPSFEVRGKTLGERIQTNSSPPLKEFSMVLPQHMGLQLD